jgi:hypothetical protein
LLSARNISHWQIFKLKVKEWKLIVQTNRIWKQGGVPKLVSDKADFKSKLDRRDKESHYILTKRPIHPKYIMIINTHSHYIVATNFIKQRHWR